MTRLLDDLALKALSLGLAIVVWFVIAGEKTSEMGLSVPVELQNVPPDLELTGDPVTHVEVRLRASPGIIQRIGPGEVAAQLDLGGTGEGERIVHLTPETIRVPFGVKVVKINPAIITLAFERTVEKVVPVRPRMIGRPAQGFEVAELASNPPEVRMTGPRSRVQEVESAFTEPVSVEGAKDSVSDTVSLGLEDPLLRILGSPQVRVTVRIREEHRKRSFEGLPIEVRGGSAQLQPTQARVAIEGPASVLARVKAAEVRVAVDVSGVDGVKRVPLSVAFGPGLAGVTLEQVEPAEVVVRRSKKK